jgi:hypothetical protein
MIRRSTLPAAVALAMVYLTLCAAPAHAQAEPSLPGPSPSPTATTTPTPSAGQPQLPWPGQAIGELLSDPASWFTRVFNTMLVALGRSTTDSAQGALDWLLGGGNVINKTPAELSYESPVVKGLWGTLRTVANAGLAVVTVVGGINLIVNPHIRAPYHGALELVPRVLVGGVLVNTSLDWGRFAIQVNNALCTELGTAGIPGWGTLLGGGAGGVLLNLIAIMVYLIMGLLLVAQMLMRLALVDALLIIAPIALLCWVVPQSHSWARLWFTTFFGTVFVQFIQVAVLQLGNELIKGVAILLPSVAASPLDGGREWLASLLLAVAVLQLARKVPRLMPGYPGGGGDSFGPLRAFASRQLFAMVLGPRTGAGAGKAKA